MLELVEEEASRNAVVVGLMVEEDSSAAGLEEAADMTVGTGQLLEEGTIAAEVEEQSAAVVLVEGSCCCHLAEVLFVVLALVYTSLLYAPAHAMSHSVTFPSSYPIRVFTMCGKRLTVVLSRHICYSARLPS